jgi:hypothetical protein
MAKSKLHGEARVSRYLNFLGLKTERQTKAEMRAGQTPGFEVLNRPGFAGGRLI